MDKQTFSEAVQRMERSLYRVAMSYTGNAPDAADAVQEALLRAWNRRETLRQERFFDTWLMRIVINECKTLLRKRKRQLPTADLPNLAAPPPDEQAMALRTALFALPEKYRVPLVLNLLEGYTLREIAAMLSLPVGTVKTRIARAKQKLEQEVSVHA